MISGFRREVEENWGFLGYYAKGGNLLPLLKTSGCPKYVTRNY